MASIRVSKDTKEKLVRLKGALIKEWSRDVSENEIIELLIETVNEDIDLITKLYRKGKFK